MLGGRSGLFLVFFGKGRLMKERNFGFSYFLEVGAKFRSWRVEFRDGSGNIDVFM